MPELIEEQEDFFIFYKNAGENFHSEDGEAGFFQSIKNECGEVFPVHRLDKITSGLVLVAKNLKSCQQLNELFANHAIQKYYLAISDRKPKKKQGWVIGDMEKARRGAWKLSTTKKNPAITQFFSESLQSGLRLYLLKPHSGKTHQLRVAMKSMGAPICGDPQYYPGEQKKNELRCYLHAYAIQFELKGKMFFYRKKPKEEGLFALKSFSDLVSEEYFNPQNLPWPKRKK